MKAAIETREIVTVAGGGLNLRGTYHKAQDKKSTSLLDTDENNRIGVLFLNSGFQPRAAGGDTAVYWADSFAKCGYPSFRLDLPGLGDSYGDVPMELLDFLHCVNAGCYSPSLSCVTKNLIERFQLSGVVIVGHCAGAVSAVYAAGASNYVKGVVVLDPYFHREEREGTGIRREFRHWVVENRLAGYLSNIYDRLKYLSLLVRRNSLPSNANVPLIRSWNRLASAGLPMLVLKAPAPNPRVGDFDYLRYVTSHPNHRIHVKQVEGTNHAFVKGLGKEAVRRHIEEWLSTYFSLRTGKENEASDKRQSSTMKASGTVSSLAGTRS